MDQFKIQCHYCRKMFFYGELTKDHVVPRNKGGRDIVENIVPSCGPCNNEKSNQMPTCDCVFCLNAVEFHMKALAGVPVLRGWFE